MVSTRRHPREFPPPTPGKHRSTSPGSSFSPSPADAISGTWSHTPSNLTLIWLAISLPLVLWDTGYIFMRPHSMPGGRLHWPIWSPYELYGRVDYIYGWPAWNNKSGFTAAQGGLNLVETAGYLVYLWIVLSKGKEVEKKGRGAPKLQGWTGSLKKFSKARSVEGEEAGWAVLVGFAVAVMTVSKTVLYWLQEFLGGNQNIGHNHVSSLIFLWIIPNGLWIVFPSYMTYVFGQEILQGLVIATGGSKKQR